MSMPAPLIFRADTCDIGDAHTLAGERARLMRDVAEISSGGIKLRSPTARRSRLSGRYRADRAHRRGHAVDDLATPPRQPRGTRWPT
jgi:hypothetical protein